MEKDLDSLCVKNLEVEMEDAIAKGDKEKAKGIKFKMRPEATKKMFTKIRTFKGSKISQLTSIKVPSNPNESASDKCSQWTTVKTPI